MRADQIGGEGITLFGCIARGDRRFFDALKVDRKEAASVAFVARIGAASQDDFPSRLQPCAGIQML
jgi:hypothetical protein